jgi:hypothetical protein
MVIFSKATTAGNFLVDFIPARKSYCSLIINNMPVFTQPLAVKHLPRWMPGSGFLKLADEWNKVVWDAANNPFQWCKDNLVYFLLVCSLGPIYY